MIQVVTFVCFVGIHGKGGGKYVGGGKKVIFLFRGGGSVGCRKRIVSLIFNLIYMRLP